MDSTNAGTSRRGMELGMCQQMNALHYRLPSGSSVYNSRERRGLEMGYTAFPQQSREEHYRSPYPASAHDRRERRGLEIGYSAAPQSVLIVGVQWRKEARLGSGLFSARATRLDFTPGDRINAERGEEHYSSSYVSPFASRKRRRLEVEWSQLQNPGEDHYSPKKSERTKDLWPPLSSDITSTRSPHSSFADGAHSLQRGSDQSHSSQAQSQLDRPEAPCISASHNYESLGPGKRIRLLGLEPGNRGDPIKLHFYYTDLEDTSLSYEALSYVCGTPIDPFWYDVNGNVAYLGRRKIQIKPNLHRALHALRLPDKVRILWVDAICINQQDLGEREAQVRLMGEIYQNARRVVVWLGEQYPAPWDGGDTETNEELAAVCDVVNHWLRAVSTTGRAYYSADTTKLESRRTLPKVEEPRHLQFWNAIARFFDRPWFFRCWIFQEIVLARTAVAKLGSFEIDWRWIGLAAAVLRTNHHDICQSLHIAGIYNAYLMYRLSRQSDLPPRKLDFLRLLRLTRQFEVTDERDRVYGLLGVAKYANDHKHGELFIKPDYEISKAELWQQVAVKILEITQDLSLLSCVQYQKVTLPCDPMQYSNPGHIVGNDVDNYVDYVDCDDDSGPFPKTPRTLPFPSWVPQWEHVFRTTISAWDLEQSFSAAEGLPRQIRITTESGSLKVNGINAGVVAYVSEVMSDDPDLSLLISKRLWWFFNTEAGHRLYATTLTAGMNPYGSQADDTRSVQADLTAYIRSTWPSFRLSQEGLSSHMELHGDASRFSEMAQRVCRSRRLFLTANGYIGLGPDVVREGDTVSILGGGDTPFLLRRSSDENVGEPPRKRLTSFLTSSKQSQESEEPGTDHYRLVGECYVEGMMKGEAVQCMNAGNALLGPIPPEHIRRHKIQSLVEQGYTEKERIFATHQALKRMETQRLEKTWFDIR
ncbi:hypothetical protein H2200_005756 [Cladophialophora chaetospira]|uniref:Heterokaryon incompatibility domain-containing protein n=1 Tax=Cladophialophora chaetospira TaxID=386627 RepID=A0AA38X9N2_9EURO|nr:hypothetical protein H2200_005756 [Cladophialophora chaetospira]